MMLMCLLSLVDGGRYIQLLWVLPQGMLVYYLLLELREKDS